MFLAKCIIALSAFLFGLEKSVSLDKKVRTLEEFRLGLGALERELSFSLGSLDVLLHKASQSSKGIVSKVFSQSEEGFLKSQKGDFSAIWCGVLEQNPLYLEEKELSLLKELGGILGKYDRESQTAALKYLGEKVTEEIVFAKETATRLRSVYLSLGFTAGMFLLVLL